MSQETTTTVESTVELSAFAAKVSARIKGDAAENTATKIEKKAKSAIKGQIAALDAKVVDLETAKEDAEDNLSNAVYATSISDNQTYVNGILRAQKAVDDAASNLDDAKKTLAYWNAALDTYFA